MKEVTWKYRKKGTEMKKMATNSSQSEPKTRQQHSPWMMNGEEKKTRDPNTRTILKFWLSTFFMSRSMKWFVWYQNKRPAFLSPFFSFFLSLCRLSVWSCVEHYVSGFFLSQFCAYKFFLIQSVAIISACHLSFLSNTKNSKNEHKKNILLICTLLSISVHSTTTIIAFFYAVDRCAYFEEKRIIFISKVYCFNRSSWAMES